MYIFRQKINKNFMQKKFRGFPCRIWGGYPCKICGDIPVNSKLITCKSYIFFNAISTCVPEVRNYGDFRQHVIPMIITCMLRGTPCDTGFSRNFYRGNICSAVIKSCHNSPVLQSILFEVKMGKKRVFNTWAILIVVQCR